MADTSFTAQQTTIVAAWLNQVNLATFQGRSPNAGTTTGVADAQILTLATGSLYFGQQNGDTFGFIAGFTNTGAATLQIVAPSGTLAAAPLQMNGAALVGGEVIAGQPYVVAWATDAWELVSLAGTAFGTALLQTVNAAALRTLLGLGALAVLNTIATAQIDANAVTSAKLGAVMPRSYGRTFAGQTNAATPTSKVDFTADELILTDSSGYPLKATTVSVTADITASGANGLDTGAEASGTWYYLYVIAKADGTVASLLSASATAPTMPADYLFRALVSAVYNNGSSNFVSYTQRGDYVEYQGAVSVLSGGSASTETAITITSAVPPIAQAFQASVYGTGDVGAGGLASGNVFLRTVTTLNQLADAFRAATNGVFGFGTAGWLANISQTLYYLFTPTTNVASISINVQILGFTLPIGGK